MTDTTLQYNASQTNENPPVGLAVLSDNPSDGALIQYLLSIDPSVNVELSLVSSDQIAPSVFFENQIIIIDRCPLA